MHLINDCNSSEVLRNLKKDRKFHLRDFFPLFFFEKVFWEKIFCNRTLAIDSKGKKKQKNKNRVGGEFTNPNKTKLIADFFFPRNNFIEFCNLKPLGKISV